MVYTISDTVTLTDKGRDIVLTRAYREAPSDTYSILSYIHEMGGSVNVLDLETDLEMRDVNVGGKLRAIENAELVIVS